MNGPHWTDEQNAFLAETYPTWQTRDICAEIEHRFGVGRTDHAVRRQADKLGLKKAEGYDRFQHMRRYTQEEDDWLREFVPGHSQREVMAAFEDRFGRKMSRCQLRGRCNYLGIRHGVNKTLWKKGQPTWNKGMTWDEMGLTEEQQERIRAKGFKPGSVPVTTGKLLDEHIDKGGYAHVKVDPRNAKCSRDYWIPKAQYVWMQHNGRDFPDGHHCMFADHDITNFDPDNLVAVPNELVPILNGAVLNQMEYYDRDSMEVAITSAKLSKMLNRLTRKRNKS